MPYGVTGAYSPAAAAETAFAGKTIASVDWNNVNTDVATALNQLGLAFFNSTAAVNFNSVADTSIAITLPTGFTNYVVNKAVISKATGTLSTSQVALYTGAGGTGVQVITSTVVTITTAAANTNNNSQSLPIANQNTLALNATPLFFRVTNPQGVAATGTVTLWITPVS